ECYGQALELARRHRMTRREMASLHPAASMTAQWGKLDEGWAMLMEVIRMAEAPHSFAHQTRVAVHIGFVARLLGGLGDEAAHYFGEAVRRHTAGTNELQLRNALMNLLETVSAMGDLERYEAVKQQLDGLTSDVEQPNRLGSVREVWARVRSERRLGLGDPS